MELRNGIVPPVIKKKARPHSLEKDVEKYYKKEIGKIGGISYKFSSPNQRGVFDQVTIIRGVVFFIEMKTVVGKPSPGQEIFYRKSRTERDAMAAYIYGETGVDLFINSLKGFLPPEEFHDNNWWIHFRDSLKKEYR